MTSFRFAICAGAFVTALSPCVAQPTPSYRADRAEGRPIELAAATSSDAVSRSRGKPVRGATTASETFGAKLRRLAASAAISNPLTSPPLMPAPAWRPNHGYMQGEVVVNGQALYMCHAAGTSAGSGGPTGAGYATIVDGTVGWVYFGASVVNTTDPAAPAVTTTIDETSLVSMGLTKLHNPVTSPSSFSFGGGVPTPAPPKATTQVSFPAVHANANNKGGNIGLDNGTNGYHWSATFVTDAPKIAIGVSYGAPASIIIDGRRLVPGGYKGAFGANPSWFLLDFTKAGGRKPRTITLEEYGNIRFAGVRTDASSTVTAPLAGDIVRVAFLGSSIEAGTKDFPTLGSLSWPVQVAKLLGWTDPWNLAIGGTGYIADRSGQSFSYAGHIDDAIGISPDIVVIGGPINDAGVATNSALTAAAISLFKTLRAALPEVPIIAMGTFPGSTGPSTIRTNSELAIKSAVQQFRDPRVFFVPVISEPFGKLITGTGDTSAPNGTGNADFYISSDRTHPVQHGVDHQALHYAARIKTFVLNALP